jgi:8-oxo-dGTP pyrophosphatase MutT (NUDIX family)
VTTTPVWRPTARILLADPDGRILLFSGREEDGQRWWFTPGGGVQRGETVEAAGVRELREETGIAVTEAELGPVVATSSSHWYAAETSTLYLGAHSYFFLRVPQARIDTGGQEEQERAVITGHHWWTAAELKAAAERVFPPSLGDLLDRLLTGGIPAAPIRLPRHN